ncbi:MAG: class I SAM-dependent methyltransferase, partial [Phycisphaerae bacterium]
RFPKRTFHCCDFRKIPYPEESFDVVIARGFSFYHYDLDSADAHLATRTVLRHLKGGGLFVMLIVTDQSGRREPGRVWQNQLADYEQHFASHARQWSVDWADGMAICSLTKPQEVEPTPSVNAPTKCPTPAALA